MRDPRSGIRCPDPESRTPDPDSPTSAGPLDFGHIRERMARRSRPSPPSAFGRIMSPHLMLGRAAIVLLFVLALPQPEGQILQVAPLARDGDVLVSFKLAQEPTDEIRSAIHSGLIVSLVYKIDLRRSSAGWIDRTIASTVVTATVRYDNLTRRYAVSR